MRPAIDPLFRSAAGVYGQLVTGVLLSGLLDDGVDGLREIKRHGGLAVVQTPEEAGFPDMPQNALARVEIDHCAPVAQIRDLVTRLHHHRAWEWGIATRHRAGGSASRP